MVREGLIFNDPVIIMFKKLLPLLFLFAGFQANAAVIWDETIDGNIGTEYFNINTAGTYMVQGTSNREQVSVHLGHFGLAWRSVYDPIAGQYADTDHFFFTLAAGLLVSDISIDIYNFTASGTNASIGSHLGGEMETGVFSDGSHLRSEWTRPAVATINIDDVLDEVLSSNNVDYMFARSSGRGRCSTITAMGQTCIYGQSYTYRVTVVEAEVPEPSIIALFAAGLFGIGFARRLQS
jgi:hypothetical protein